MALLEGSKRIEEWLDTIGAAGATPSEIARRTGLSRASIWMAFKRERVSDSIAIGISDAWHVDRLTAISLATGVSIKSLKTPPSLTELPVLVYPPCLLDALEARWEGRQEPKHTRPLAWAPAQTISSAAFTASGVARHLPRLSEETDYHPSVLREQFHNTIPIKTAVAAAEATSSSYALFLMATGVVTPETYRLNFDDVGRIISRMSVEDLAAITTASVKTLAQVIVEDAGVEEDHYR